MHLTERERKRERERERDRDISFYLMPVVLLPTSAYLTLFSALFVIA
jgi:hypothetical protein